MQLEELQRLSIQLLKKLIATPSFSKDEDKTAIIIDEALKKTGVTTNRLLNNVWAYNQFYDPNLPTILLNSHHDTVKPNSGYTINPYEPTISEGKLFGLGSNDAGGSLVSLLATFLYFYSKKELKYNLIFAATAEEEISGFNGIEVILNKLGKIDFAIVGEPTEMHLAIAEKGLLVLDCTSSGTSAHAAHDNPNNAIYNALKDIEWFRTYSFPEKSNLLGEVKMNVTIIQSGSQHNVIPNECKFTVDIRTTDKYSNAEVLETVKKNVQCQVKARSLRLNSSSISIQHPFIEIALKEGKKVYGSPTTSDQALMNFPSLKLGPGNSLRSHSSNEYIFIDEIKEGINTYINLLSKLILV